MYKIIAVDLDGTLLSPDNKITTYTQKVINLLIKRNIYFIFASGRHYADLINIKNSLKIKFFIISSNGARIYDLNNKLIFQNYLDEDIARTLCEIGYFNPSIITQIYRKNRWYINNNKLDNNFCPTLSSLKYNFFSLNNLQLNKISKIFFTSKNFLELNNLEKEIIKRLGVKININFSLPGCLEVTSRKASKGHGLKLISSILGISLKKFIAIGDGMNDQDMLSIVGKSCIMENADPNLKKSLPHSEIIGSNKNDGVAVFLKRIFLEK
ncbi:Cof-type HAD-IIB family hydrolase [Buchnera aphidicola (Melanaphis sacchari)]|uniref:Cof-type HAD-IIB family hydrolase n=1 Tax=Buchnera aphidicola (Melanaphis sacchari) TaxID=2173854 RepID=A0A2U8DGZ9_9GAMM|nr:Cof-type HAD-IIB family hydrolase [Buchnera aphidicola]AWH90725.1 Cof-type HAD-IIB family hydrolase [Buchnera aphidicola (Melanaphis sacchari)]